MSQTFFCDSETLGVYDNSIILSIGILKEPNEKWDYESIKANRKEFFEEVKKNSLYIEIDAKEQARNFRKVTKSTLEWWEKQSDDARNVLEQKNAVSMMDAYKQIYYFFVDHNINTKDIFFSRRLFEGKLLQHFCEETLKQKSLIQYYQWRDPATLIWALNDDYQFDMQTFSDLKLVKHNALSDCIIDFIKIRELLKG